MAKDSQQDGEAEPRGMPGGGIATLQKKSTRSKTGDGQDSSLVRKTSARKSTKSVPASDDPINLEPVAAETPASSVGDELDRIASGNAVLAMEEVGTETFQPTPVEEPQYCPRLLSAADRANLDHKYGRRGSQIALDVLIGKVTSQQTVALENLFFHTARVFKFQLGEKKFFINLVQDSSGSNSGRVQISLSCDKGTIQVCLDSLDDLAAFAPELSNFSIGSYPAPVQDMLLNSLLSPLWDRLSTLLAAKVSMRLAEAPQGSAGNKFSFSVRMYDDTPHEGKEVGLLLSARVVMDLPLAEEIGKFIQQVPTAILRTFSIPFHCENRVAETTISREDLASLRLGDVILLDNSAAIEAKQTRLLGLSPYEFACAGNGNKLTITGISGTSA